MRSPKPTTPPKDPVRLPIWKELIEHERRFRAKLIKVRAKRRRMPTHAECLEALAELAAEERERDLGRKVLSTAKIDGKQVAARDRYRVRLVVDNSKHITTVLSTAHIDGGAYRWVEMADGSSRVENWGPKGWAPGGASLGEIVDSPPVGSAFAAELGIPPSDLA